MHTNNDDKKSITCPSQKIVFFDLDGTILSGISSENSFILYLFKHNYIGLSQLLKCMLFTFRWLSKFKMQIFVKNKAYLAGMPIEQMKELGENFVKKELLCDLRPKLQHRIEEHRKAGDMLVLLTGSLEFLARIFAEHLGINHVEATHLVKNKHLFSHHPPIQHPYGKEKLTIAKRVVKNMALTSKRA